jgi:hypothetical protein
MRSSLGRRLGVAKRRREARKAESYIATYQFPTQTGQRLLRRNPDLFESDWASIEQGLREWFVCCAWRGCMTLGMPSRLVDDGWHEFILDSVAYLDFCIGAFGTYLHHIPEEGMGVPMNDALAETVRAWDRSAMGSDRESVLWDLDSRLGAHDPAGLTPGEVESARTRMPYDARNGWVYPSGQREGALGASTGTGAGWGASCGGGGGCGSGS